MAESSTDTIRLIREKIRAEELRAIAEERFGDMVKAVVDIERGIMAIGGELHADEERVLLEQGSKQEQLWGINLYPDEYPNEQWVEYDSMINIRPGKGNRSWSVEDPQTRAAILQVVTKLIAA